MAEAYSEQTLQSEVEDFDLDQLAVDHLDLILMLDIIEHIHDPEAFLLKLRRQYARHNAPKLIITTGNVAFAVVRLTLLLGQFNYGKKGILDRDHRRLFTFSSMARTLKATGYDILEVHPIPAPYPLAVGDNVLSRTLLTVNQIFNRVFRGLGAYQMAFVVRPRPTIDHLLANAHDASEQRLAERVY
jgi:hypothetical protein